MHNTKEKHRQKICLNEFIIWIVEKNEQIVGPKGVLKKYKIFQSFEYIPLLSLDLVFKIIINLLGSFTTNLTYF